MARSVSHTQESKDHGVLANREDAVVVVPSRPETSSSAPAAAGQTPRFETISRRTLSYYVGPGRRRQALVSGALLPVVGVLLMGTPLARATPWWPIALGTYLPSSETLVGFGMCALLGSPIFTAVLLLLLDGPSRVRIDLGVHEIALVAPSGERVLRWSQIAGFRDVGPRELTLVARTDGVLPDMTLPVPDERRGEVLDLLEARGLSRVS